MGFSWQFVKHSDLVKIGQKQWNLYMKMYVFMYVHRCLTMISPII